MICSECKKEINQNQHKMFLDKIGVDLCERHTSLILKLMAENGTSIEAVRLYYGLKAVGIKPTLEWWDGKKFVNLAISRVKLNIEIDKEYKTISHEQAMKDLEEAMHSFKNGFTTLRIPHFLIENHLEETVSNLVVIIEGLKPALKWYQAI